MGRRIRGTHDEILGQRKTDGLNKKVMHSGRMMWHNKDEEDMEGDWVNEDDDTIGEDGEGLG